MKIKIVILFLAFMKFHVAASEIPCSGTDYDQIVSHLKLPTNWDTIYRTYKEFNRCLDNASLGELYSDVIVETLSNQWDTFDKLEAIAALDNGFREFIVTYVNSTAATASLERVAANCIMHKKKSAGDLCSEIKRNAIIALHDCYSITTPAVKPTSPAEQL